MNSVPVHQSLTTNNSSTTCTMSIRNSSNATTTSSSSSSTSFSTSSSSSSSSSNISRNRSKFQPSPIHLKDHTQKHNSSSICSSYFTLYYMLSIIVWFLLCVGVVMKHHSLINIFYSFLGSTVVAFASVAVMMGMVHSKMMKLSSSVTTSPRTTTTTTFTSNSTSSSNMNMVTIWMLIGIMIGVLACTFQLAMIIRNFIIVNSGRGSMNAVSLSVPSSIISTYSIAAGYLVFDQWYTFCMNHWLTSSLHRSSSSINCKQKCSDNRVGNDISATASASGAATIISYSYSPWWYNKSHSSNNSHLGHRSPYYYKSLYTVVEDAVTLIVILIMLVQQQHVPHSYSDVDMHPNPNSWNAHVYGILWPIYKLLRLLSISSSVLYPNTNYSSQTESSISKTKSNDPTANIDKEALRKPQDASIQNEALETKDHNKHQSIWRIYGKEYDLSNFVRDHPGGYEAIMLGCNRDDCTALFRSYHPSPLSYHRATKVLQSYRIPTNTNNYNDNNHSNPGQGNELATSSSPTTEKTPESKCRNDLDATHVEDDHVDEFYDLLCERVAKELWDRHRYHILKDRTATPMRVAYYVFVTFGVFVSAYNYGIRGSHILFGSIPFAVFGWLFGALGHDAGHYAVCRTHPIVNDICVWAMCLLCNPIVWQHQHTYGHHSHTNDVEHDPDLHHFTTLLRVHEKFQYCGVYRYQKHPLYVFFAYTFVVFGTCIWIPWGIIQEGSLYGIVEWTDRHRPWRTTGMYAHLIAYTIFIIIVPFFVYKHWYMAWLAVTTHISLSGIIFAIFSQINHLNEPSLQRTSNAENNKLDTGDESVDKPKIQKIKDSWSVRQIEASNNFCPQSVLWYILSNGLNLQIEHHLFPGINHCHLPKIQSIVRDVCREYGVPYKCYDSWYDIMKATLDWLNRLSEKHLAMVRPGPNIGSCQ